MFGDFFSQPFRRGRETSDPWTAGGSDGMPSPMQIRRLFCGAGLYLAPPLGGAADIVKTESAIGKLSSIFLR
jgi:hypothetical protein